MSSSRARVVWAIVIVAWLLALGFVAILAEGIMPKTPRQVLLALLVVGPVLLLGESLLEVACYGIGRATLSILTLGWMRAERLDETQSFPWYGISRLKDGQYVASGHATTMIGLALLLMGVIAGVGLYA
jgi:hypothetical protein